MTVNKITNAPTPNEQIDKINEIIDNLSSSSITVDSALSTTSTNPVQNKVITTSLNGKQGTISDLSTIRSGASKGATAVQPGDLANVATSGSYNDLSNKPTIPTVNNATLTIQKNGSTVKTFTANASSNVTANITVPTKTSELTNDSGYTTNTGTVTKVNNTSPDANGNVTLSIPAAQIQSDWSQTNTSSKDYIKNKPTIPSVGNGTITITQGGTTKGSFTTNQSGNATIALDAGGGTATTVKINGTSITSSGVANIKTNGTYNASSNKIATMSDVPTNTNQLTNGAGFITGITSSDVTTALGYTPANTTLSNLGETSSTNFDGSPTYKYVRLVESKATVNTSTNLKSTGYLPNDNYRYEVLVGNALRAGTSIAAAISNVASPLTNSNSGFTCKTRVSADSRYSYNNCWIPLDTNGIIYYQTDGAPSTGITFEIYGYRRIGTNT